MIKNVFLFLIIKLNKLISDMYLVRYIFLSIIIIYNNKPKINIKYSEYIIKFSKSGQN